MKKVNVPAAGNFVLQVPIADELLARANYKTGEEFTHMAYTAVTCEPSDFASRYNLRQNRLRGRDATKIAIVVTMYNEEECLFVKSLLAIQKNIAYLCSEDCPFGWGPDGWKAFVVVIVSDGVSKINPRVENVLGSMGLWLGKDFLRTSVNLEKVTAHVFELTSQVAVDRDFNIRDATHPSKVVPTQIIFILKQNNAKKINSHKWFFQAVCEIIHPEVVMLLDVGTKPSPTSLYELYRAFERDPNVGGACGEIKAELGRGWKKLINPLVGAQNFEYKMSNILDKPLESVFGYISVLPGAFSAYRYQALQGRPLEQYFHGENLAKEQGKVDLFSSNLYLAEDRVLCFELITKENAQWILKYVKAAQAETDVPSDLPELVSQRRRWLNGSFFAALHSIINVGDVFRSRHSAYQKMLFMIEFLYILINILFSWFQLANFYLAFYFLFDLSNGPNRNNNPPFGQQGIDPFYPYGGTVFQVLREVYLFGLVTIFISSLGNRPQGSRWLYYAMSIMFACIMVLMLFVGIWGITVSVSQARTALQTQSFFSYLFSNRTFRDLLISTSATYGLYLASSIIHLDPWHVINSFVQYLLLLPTYTNVFMIYSFCNLHDVSWGTKGDNNSKAEANSVNIVTKANGEKVLSSDVEIPEDSLEASIIWKEFAKKLKGKPPTAVSKPIDQAVMNEDSSKEYRTKVVLFWMFCNAALVIVFTNNTFLDILFPRTQMGATGPNYVNPYLTFLFWSVAFLSFFRFVGSALYMSQWWKEKALDKAQALSRKQGGEV